MYSLGGVQLRPGEGTGSCEVGGGAIDSKAGSGVLRSLRCFVGGVRPNTGYSAERVFVAVNG